MRLIDKLRERGLPSTTVPIRTGRVAAAQAARTALDEAIRLRDKHPGIDEALEQAVHDARAALDACYEDVTVKAIEPALYEALVALHPPTEEQADQGLLWDANTFMPALLAACVGISMSEAEWADMLAAGPLAVGESAALFEAAVKVNGRSPDLRVGKESARTGS